MVNSIIDGLTGSRTIAMQDNAKSGTINNKQAAANNLSSPAADATADQLSLTANAERLQQLEKSMAGELVAPLDSARIDEVRQRISNGEYVINAERIAEKFLATEDLLGKL